MSRGLSKVYAEKLIATGFLTPFVDNIKNEAMKQEVLDNIEEKLG
jgi:Fe-S cluster assembly scaffold protein SufB